MPIPQVIKDLKPKEFGPLEIRSFIDNVYYVYQISYKYDKDKGKTKKITGKSIGKITEKDGFIPNANGMRVMIEKKKLPSILPEEPIVKNYGTYELLQQLSPNINDNLKKYFPDIFREIRTISLLRLVDSVPNHQIREMFLDSYLSDISPDLSLSENSVRDFINKLGTMQERIDNYMRNDVLPNTTLLFDGTSIFVDNDDSLSERGYNPDRSLNPQSRVLYIFEKDSNRPVFYRVLQGSIVDRASFIDIIEDSNCKDCIIIADKGFFSKKNVSFLNEYNHKFILPLQSNTSLIKEEFYNDNDDRKFDGVFSYKKRVIWFKKNKIGANNNWIYIFRDDNRKSDMRGSFIEKVENDYGEEGYEPMDVIKQNKLGYFSFYSNMDISSKDIYLLYKSRWDIENCFDYLKNSISHNRASYARNDNYLRGWMFLNHISLQYYYGLINSLRSNKLDNKYTTDDIIRLTKNIYRVIDKNDNTIRISNIKKKTKDILDKLGVNLGNG